jgi:hypothetical protein
VRHFSWRNRFPPATVVAGTIYFTIGTGYKYVWKLQALTPINLSKYLNGVTLKLSLKTKQL